MTKSQLTEEVAKETSQSQVTVAKTLNSAIAIIQNMVASGTTVSINGFISLTPITKKACEGEINGTKYSKPQRQGIKLKASKPFKDLVEAGTQGVQDER